MKTTLAKAVWDWTARGHRWPYATGPPGRLTVLSGKAGRSLRRRFPARRASRHARAAVTHGFPPLRLPQMNEPWRLALRRI